MDEKRLKEIMAELDDFSATLDSFHDEGIMEVERQEAVNIYLDLRFVIERRIEAINKSKKKTFLIPSNLIKRI